MRIKETMAHGRPFLVNEDDACLSSWLIRGKQIDEQEILLIRKNVKPGDWAVDIGANIGYYTALLSELVGPSGHVFAFEPEADNFKLLMENLALRGCENVSAVRAGMWGEPGEMPLYLSPGNLGAHSMVYFDAEKQKAETVPVYTYDGYCKIRSQGINFVKIDVEGAEAEVLAGAESIFRGPAPRYLMLELNGTMQSRAERPMGDTLRRLANFGFRMTAITRQGQLLIARADIDGTIERLFADYVNVWCER